jgi:hypothetical protein
VQSGGIALREKQGLQQVMSDPSNYTDADGNIDIQGPPEHHGGCPDHRNCRRSRTCWRAEGAHVEAVSSLNKLGDDNRTRVANVLSTIKPDSPPELVNKSLDALGKAYGGKIDPWVNLFKQGYSQRRQSGAGRRLPTTSNQHPFGAAADDAGRN